MAFKRSGVRFPPAPPSGSGGSSSGVTNKGDSAERRHSQLFFRVECHLLRGPRPPPSRHGGMRLVQSADRPASRRVQGPRGTRPRGRSEPRDVPELPPGTHSRQVGEGAARPPDGFLADLIGARAGRTHLRGRSCVRAVESLASRQRSVGGVCFSITTVRDASQQRSRQQAHPEVAAQPAPPADATDGCSPRRFERHLDDVLRRLAVVRHLACYCLELGRRRSRLDHQHVRPRCRAAPPRVPRRAVRRTPWSRRRSRAAASAASPRASR